MFFLNSDFPLAEVPAALGKYSVKAELDISARWAGTMLPLQALVNSSTLVRQYHSLSVVPLLFCLLFFAFIDNHLSVKY